VGFFTNEEHYINFISKVHKCKFNTKLSNKRIELFRKIYSIKYYNSLFETFSLNSLPEIVSWEFGKLVPNKKTLKNFYDTKTKVLAGAKLFVKNPDKLLTAGCKTFMNYCGKKKNKLKLKQHKTKFSKGAEKVLEGLLTVSGVYFVFDKHKMLNYIGKSYDLGNRIIDSIEERKGCYFSYAKTKSRIDADILEPYLIWLKKPPLNSEFVTNDRPSFKLKIPKMSKIIKVYK